MAPNGSGEKAKLLFQLVNLGLRREQMIPLTSYLFGSRRQDPMDSVGRENLAFQDQYENSEDLNLIFQKRERGLRAKDL